MKRQQLRSTASLPIAIITFAASTAAGAPKPLITYFQPMPIVTQLSTTVWGASTVGSRDPGNGLEDKGDAGGVAPHAESKFYWDGKILKGEDGKYHMYASYWPYSGGFGPPAGANGTGWQSSVPMQAISNNVLGPYTPQGDCYTANQEGNNKGHNTTALVAPTGAARYTLSVGEIVAGQMFGASSANGPWTLLGPMKTNTNGHAGCGTLSSNFTFTVGPDNRFWATSRSGCVMDSDQVLGPYKVETDSVLPNLENNSNANAEDEVIWYSGGYFHIVYNYWHVQRAYHIMSKNGVTNWMSTGLAYQGVQTPANANSNWLRYTDGTVNQWHNMERASVYQEGGHVTHFTFAVTDVDKNTSAVNTGGSKILVVPFNGVQFDCDNGDSASCAELSGGQGGSGGSGGAAGAGGSAGAAGNGAGGTGNGAGGSAGVAGSAGAASGQGGAGSPSVGIGGAPNSSGGTGPTTGGATGATGGTPAQPAGASSSAGSAGSDKAGQTDGGCSCNVASSGGSSRPISALLLLGAVARVRRRRKTSALD